MREGWKKVRLEEVATFKGGGTPSKKKPAYWGGEIPWVSPKDMKSTYISTSIDTVTEDGVSNSAISIIPEGALLLVVRSGILARTVPICIASTELTVNQDLKAIVPSRRISFSFLYYFLISQESLLLERVTRSATVHRLQTEVLKELRIPLPDKNEQKRIVAILDEAFEGIDTVVANTEKNLANAHELFESSIVHRVFGDPDAKGWEKSTVEQLAFSKKGAIRTGPFGSQLLHSEFVDEGIAVLGIDNAVNNEFAWGKRRFITEEKYEALKRYTVKPGDVIITIMGTCGRCAIVPDDIPTAINTKHLCCITLDQDRCLPDFLHSYFLYHPVAREYLEKHAKGSIMAGLNMGIIKSLPVRLPVLEEQSRIAMEVDNLRNEAQRLDAIYQQKLTALSELKQSLLQKAFSGELTAECAEAAVEEATA